MIWGYHHLRKHLYVPMCLVQNHGNHKNEWKGFLLLNTGMQQFCDLKCMWLNVEC